jgi:hypothetical protein
MFRECALHLARLNAETADFELIVGAAKEFEGPIGVAGLHQVTRTVHSLPRNGGKWVGEKTLGREIRGAQIASSETVTTHVQFAGFACTYRDAPAVQDVSRATFYGLPNGRKSGPLGRIRAQSPAGDEMGFSWTIVVIQAASRKGGEKARNSLGHDQAFARGDDVAQVFRNDTQALGCLCELQQCDVRQE